MRCSRILGAALPALIMAASGAAHAITVEAEAGAPAEVGRAVTFSARAEGSGAITYSWNFGDGTATSTSTAPAHVFPAAGTYTVSLTATDGWGKAATVTRSVTVG